MRYIILTVLMITVNAFAFDDLTQMETRKARKATSTFYTGEDGTTRVRQPQTLVFNNTSTGRQVMLLSQTPNLITLDGTTEYGWQPWSADGKRMAFAQNHAAGCYTLGSGKPWYVANSDGSYLRAACESVNRTSIRRSYFDWSPIYPDVSYAVGYNYNGVTGKDSNGIYREAVADTAITPTLIVDMIAANTTTQLHGSNKHAITGDGLYYMASIFAENEPFYISQIEPEASRALKLTYNGPALDQSWGTTTATAGDLHDQNFVGNASMGYWIYFLVGNTWWRERPWGTDNGAPNHTPDTVAPYDWWVGTDAQKEIQVLNGAEGTLPNFAGNYWSHAEFDQWGNTAVFSDTEGVNPGPAAFNVDTATAASVFTDGGGAQYHAYTAWSDYFASSCGASVGKICITKYNASSASDGAILADLHSTNTGQLTNPGQSPDGTKIIAKSDWLIGSTIDTNVNNAAYHVGDLYSVVAYNPHPPEVKSVTATGGTVTVKVFWNLSSTTRGYTTRGWPNEDTDQPPPPREVKEFRLWEYVGAAWVPVKTFVHDIWDRYDFSDGSWISGGDEYPTTVTGVADATHIYAVTSIEHSGLESRTLSNTFTVTLSSGAGVGEQLAAYPADPKGATDFYTTAPGNVVDPLYAALPTAGQYEVSWTQPVDATLVRYYNIYAKDGSAPTAVQQDRIASVPATACTAGDCVYVDWLGKPDGSTKYLVTAVDFQGNESGADAPAEGDAIPPVTSLSSAARIASKATITLTSNETATTYCSTDGTNPPTAECATKVVYPGETLLYYSVDTALNEESVKSQRYGWPQRCN